jgi:allophanate hydrolase
LYGIPFAIKDNIDLANIPTTAGCPDYAYTPEHSAFVVQRLMEAGAIPVGKTNLDQFATGLVGVRSPYGACRNSINPDYVSGGSSSGSAVSVALGLASFSLGTDTAGSGRVPAAFNNLIGLKPSCGRLSATGVVPACRTLDTISVFALTAADAATVLASAEGEDPADAYTRAMPPAGYNFGAAPAFRFGVPRTKDLEFHGNAEGPQQFAQAVAHLCALGGTPVEIDLTPFRAVATLLYEGPWVAERYAAIRSFIEAKPQSLHPVTRAITEKGALISAPDTFEALYRLKALERLTRPVWQDIDCLVTPTAGSPYTIAAVEADPVRLNSNLGHYTNFVNLLDLSAVAVPTGFMSQGMPFGVTLVARCGQDLPLLTLASRLHARTVSTVGATSHAPHLVAGAPDETPFPSGQVQVAVCGAHLSGLPLNHQLTQRGAQLVKTLRSAPHYKLFALPGGPPLRPGMLRVAQGGSTIELEVWEMSAHEFGSFVAGIPSPLGIGTVALEDGTHVQGFVCEGYATAQAQDITHHGGWRAYLADSK